MAQLPGLIEALEAFHPHDGAAIRYAAKSLRAGKLMTPGHGGRGAAPMTSSDAVNLLMALNLAQTPGDYLAAVQAGFELKLERRSGVQNDEPKLVKAALVCDRLADVLTLMVERGDELALPRRSTDPHWIDREDVTLGEHPHVDVDIVHLVTGFLAMVRLRWGGMPPFRDVRLYFRTIKTIDEPQGRWRTTHFDETLFWALKRTVDDVPRWAWPGVTGRR